ncbi:Uu.00g018980.m01.CDS01 [Anthostomella pinea]|uniref:Altered inheritance of mitochondria protein 41 n=1 Tax=Anthostomella pinea TaxID=933095 RepID=A0AAI8VZ67_9PEZI|nr:Uu.00g018980.m01.CDS01 [Anthostomella pinea]
MAFRPSQRMTSSLLRSRLNPSTSCPHPSRTHAAARLYSSSGEAPPPPLLQKLKGDLKTAMRAKDAARLTVLRSVLSATLNASKTASPITTDAKLVALLRKQQKASGDASAEFSAAGRQDLVDKEQAQIKILDEYVAGSGVEEASEEQLRTVVGGVITALTSEGAVEGGRAKMGDVMKKLLAPGGPLEGKNVEKSELAKIVKEFTG